MASSTVSQTLPTMEVFNFATLVQWVVLPKKHLQLQISKKTHRTPKIPKTMYKCVRTGSVPTWYLRVSLIPHHFSMAFLGSGPRIPRRSCGVPQIAVEWHARWRATNLGKPFRVDIVDIMKGWFKGLYWNDDDSLVGGWTNSNKQDP